MATVGDIVVNLATNSAPWNSGLAGARSSLGSFTSGIGPAIGKIAAFGTAMAGIGGGIAIGAGINNALSSIDDLAKASDKLGVTTESLAGLGHAANLSGVAVDTLHSSMLKLSKNVSAASSGSASMRDTFKELGVDFAKLQQLAPDQQFLAVADAINAVTNQSDKIRLVTEVFGKSGGDLLPLLAEGSSGLQAMQREAEELGLTFSRVDAAKVEEACDAIDRMKGAFEGLFNTLAIGIAPVLSVIMERITDVVGGLGDMIQALGIIADDFKGDVKALFVPGPTLRDVPKPFGIESEAVAGSINAPVFDEAADAIARKNDELWQWHVDHMPTTKAFGSGAVGGIDLGSFGQRGAAGLPEGLLKGSKEALDKASSSFNARNDPQQQVARNTQQMSRTMTEVLRELRGRETVAVGAFQ